MKKNTLIFVILLIGMPSLAFSTQPLEALQAPIDQVISTLSDIQYQDDGKLDLQRQKLWEIIREVFDFSAVSRRTLARNWKKFNQQEKKEFTDIFARFLGNIYLDRIQGEHKNEKVVYLGQDLLTESKALVKTKILNARAEIPVDYRMQMREGTWRIYDVNIEGISLVKNYRSQFKKILMKDSPARLIERLKEKVKQQEEG